MQEDTIIQKNLFAIDNENIEQKEIAKIPEDLSVDDLKKESQNRPRQRKSLGACLRIWLVFLRKLCR